MAGQSVRPSQFITTYGPGAILEGPDGPRIIYSLERSGLFGPQPGRRPSDFDITDQRLSRALLNNAGIVRLPTNAELGMPDSAEIYNTATFPAWSLCVEHRVLYRAQWNVNRGCPDCPTGPPWDIWREARREAIRFVLACPAGHLDDVDWVGIVAHRRPHCRPAFLRWGGAGGALRDIDVVCPACGGEVNLGLAYGRDLPCNGRQPELGQAAPGACPAGPRTAKIMQRGAANLRVPELVTAIAIPPLDSPLHRILGRPATRGALRAAARFGPITTKQQVVDLLQDLADAGDIPVSDPVEVDRFDEADVVGAVATVLAGGGPGTPQSLREEEFEKLREAAASGAPPVPPRTPGMPPRFEVIRAAVRPFAGPQGTMFRVTPVSRLEVLMVQVGYRRVLGNIVPPPPPVSTVLRDAQREWYPGVELFGEGVFLDLAPGSAGAPAGSIRPSGDAADEWLQAWVAAHQPGATPPSPGGLEPPHPLHVWWHTLAHRIISALSVDSGYSSSAVRERVYTEIDPASGQGRGGVLLYTVQPGGDGTLGGLVSLVPNFGRVLQRAFRDLDACSNDPLCGEERFALGRPNGAACYACLLVSETSCEARNTGLDRTVLLDDLP